MELTGRVTADFWENKRVFLTGHTGFKGGWLALWLQQMGAKVKGYALSPHEGNNLFDVADVPSGMISEIGDIRNLVQLSESIQSFRPEIVIHMAAQPLVRESYVDPIGTYATNVMGTAHLLEACRTVKELRAVVVVTTDKCYENQEWHWGYRENEPMGGYDPYSSSKGCAELVTAAFRRSYYQGTQTAIASARAGNVIGGGDWSEDRLIPDILDAFNRKAPIIIRNPLATRPWQHVLEPLSGYLMLAEALYHKGEVFAEAWNFGPEDSDCREVQWILDHLKRYWPHKVAWQLDKNNNPHEAKFLKLDCSKARARLKWKPRWRLEKTLENIVIWNKAWKGGQNMKEHCLNEIDRFNGIERAE